MTPTGWLLLTGLALILTIAAIDLRTKGTRGRQAQEKETAADVAFMRALSDPTDWRRVRRDKDDADNAEWWSE